MRQKAYVLAVALLMIPILVLLAFTVVGSVLSGAGFALQAQHKARAFYLAESAVNIAYHCFQADNFAAYTHESDGTPTPSASGNLLATTVFPDLIRDRDGWYRWNYRPGDPLERSYTECGLEEDFRFQVLFPSPGYFRIVAEARVGQRTARQTLEGVVEPAFNYAVFDNGDLADFTRSSSEQMVGKVHANGDLYVRPYKTEGLTALLRTVFENTNPNLEIFTDSFTAGGQIIRHIDPWGQLDDGGTVALTNTATGSHHLFEGTDQGRTGAGNAYDSYHSDWTSTGTNGALARWDTAVVDRELGAKVRSTPLRETFETGGYYSQRAALSITDSSSTPWLSEATFYNQAEERLVTVKELDLAAFASSGAWPSNGLIHSEVPLRIINGGELAGPLTIASASTIYIRGDFNKKFPNSAAKAAGVPQHQAAALMTSDRVYRMTSSFDDAASTHYPTVLELATGAGFPEASDPKLYPEDDENVLEVNGALVDGTPTTDVRAWIDEPTNPHYIPNTGINNPYTGFLDRKTKQIPSGPNEIRAAFPQSEDLLENLQQVRLRGTGALMHLRVAKMATFDNSDADATTTPWVVKSNYIPPHDQIAGEAGVLFQYDPALATPLGALSAVPFAPNVARKTRWSSE